MTLTWVQAPTLPGSLLQAAGRGSACPRAAGAWLDTPLNLYMFILLLCSFLNQVLPRSVPVCSGQGTCASWQGQAGLVPVPLGQLDALP